MENKKDEISNNEEANNGLEFLVVILSVIFGIGLFVFLMRSIGGSFFGAIFAGLLTVVGGFLCHGILECVIENLKKVLMFMGIVVLVLASILLIKLILF